MNMLTRLQTALSAAFFRHFFQLLLLAISIAQWACVAWGITMMTDATMPLWAHGLAIIGTHGFNLWLVERPRPRPRRPRSLAFRSYAASALISLFCAVFLLLISAVWWTVVGVGGQLQAVTFAGPAIGSEGNLDGAFRWVASGGMAGIALLFAYGYMFGHRRVHVSHVHLQVRGSWPTAVPLRIVHLSDIHIGQNLPVEAIRAFVTRVNDLAADLVCITGDIIDGPDVDYGAYLPVLAELRARVGVVAILGNHDHRAGAADVIDALRLWTPFHVLRDDAVTFDVAGTALHVIGLDDRGRDWARGVVSDARLAALVSEAPHAVPIVLLAHRPDIFPQAVAHGVALTLSGHTHGGQLALPWFGGRRPNLAEFITQFPRGLYDRDGHFLYVSCGIGVTSQPVRLFTPREITVIHLTGAPLPEASDVASASPSP